MTFIIRSLRVRQAISAILILSFLNLMNGCYYYKAVQTQEPPESAVANLGKEFNYFIIHSGDQVKHMYNVAVDSTKITGTLENLSGHSFYQTTKPEQPNRYRKNAKINESAVKDEVHIYVSGLDLKNGNIDIPLTTIQKIDVYDPATGATVASWVFPALGVAASIFGIVMVIVLLTKSSCPFVYAYDGTGYAFTGEIFSGATQPGIEREDFLPLHNLSDNKGLYSVKIANKVKEIQHIDLVELLAIDHEAGVSVLADKYGNLHTFGDLKKPLSGTNGGGTDILPFLSSRDSLFYTGDPKMTHEGGIEEIVLKFARPALADSAKLIIKAKNDFWLETVIARFHEMFGDAYDDFSLRQEKASKDELEKWMTDQHIPLTVYVEKNGRWEYLDYFNIAGPMAFKDDILAFSLDGLNTDTLTLKLDYGFLFWDIDYAAIDFSRNTPVNVYKCPIQSAKDENGIDRKQLLSGADRNYYDQEEIGNEVHLKFENPSRGDQSRTFLMHTKGYYKILRDSQGKPQLETLREFRKAGRLPSYSRELFEKALEEYELSSTTR